MKRRADEVQFGARTPQRILQATHSSGLGPNIHYHINTGVVKTNTTENPNIGGPAPTVQYTTSYPPNQPIPTVKTNIGGPAPTVQYTTSKPQIIHKTVSAQQPMQQQQTQATIQPAQIQQVQQQPPTNVQSSISAQPTGQEKFQRLKVEDALKYLDQVKYKFGNQPQVYNDFLDIMKEFKSQSIDTPGVIQRVSNLFKGHPELIVGFNTFLPPGYKIEVQANDQGVAFQVSVSMPSPSGGNICLQQPTSPHRGSQIIHNMQPIMQHTPQNLHVSIQPQPQQQAPSPLSTQSNYSTTVNKGLNQLPQQPQPQQQPQQQQQTTGGSSHATTVMTSHPPPQTINEISARTTIMAAHTADVNSQGHNLHHISQAHQSIIQAEQTGANQNQNQPVEFNHAISYVNKIKIRFQNQPEKYKKFLEILHAYQMEQKVLKEGTGNLPQKQLTEAEVYSQVAKLFDQQEDLLREFGQFLPDATNHSTNQFINRVNHNEHKKITAPTISTHPPPIKPYNNSPNNLSRLEREYHPSTEKDYHRSGTVDKERNHVAQKFGGNAVKRSPSFNSMGVNHIIRDRDGPSPPKRHKPIFRDVTLAEASKFGSLNDYAFFDKVRKALRSPEVYENFLRCLTLFNQEIISRVELVCLITPFLSKFPELHRWFQDFLGSQSTAEGISLATAQRQDRNQGEMAQEIDLSTCKRLGASYCALPKTSEARKCSGRTNLCREVLNDTWVSFPTWAEDSTFVTSRKTQYEEIIYRCEDERFELDVVIETNASTIRVLEGVQKKISRMSQDELAKFKLDDCLGGSSPTIHQRSLKRVYGDKAADIIQGLKKTPALAVQVVLRRLKAKDEEWREAQKSFNKQWREQNEKYYLKSLDHQGINFKQNDIKMLRSKSLFNDIESLCDERHEHNDDSDTLGPHLVLPYKDKTILDDAANLLIHHVKRQTAIQKQEKTRIKHILRHFIPDLFFWPRQQLSDDERDDDDKDMDVDPSHDDATTAKTSKDDPQPNTGNSSTSAPKSTPSASTNATPAVTKTTTAPTITSLNAEIKNEPNESNTSSGNTNANTNTNRTNKTPNASQEDTEQNLENDTNSTNRIPKAEFPFLDATSSAITDSSNKSDDPATEEAYTLFFANTNWYLFLRLHAILCERLRTMYERAQILANEEHNYRGNRRESTAVALRLKPMSEIQVEDYYPTFLDMLKSVLDGNMDSNHYEDSLREMFGIHAYIAFTLDRVVQNAVRQLQHCVTERSALEAVDLYHQEQRKSGAGGFCKTASKRLAAELAYQRRAETNSNDENCFKVYIYKIDCRVTIELMDSEHDDTEKNVQNAKTWSKYTDRMANPVDTSENSVTNQATGATTSTSTANSIPTETSPVIKEEKLDDEVVSRLPRRQLFLGRNIRKFKQRNALNKLPSTESPNSPEDSKTDDNGAGTSTSESKQSLTTSKVSTTTVEMASVNIDSVRGSDDSDIIIKSTAESVVTNETVSSTTINSKSNDQIVMKNTTETSSATVTTTITDQSNASGNNNNNNIQPPATDIKSRALRRVGSDCNEGYFIDDRSEININFQKYRMVFVVNKDAVFYKKNAFRQARKTHPIVTKTMDAKFRKFVQSWCAENVNTEQIKECNEWFMGKQADLIPNIVTVKVQENNLTKTPYIPYNRYRVQRVNSS